jgi:hypothetical protein
LGKSADIKKEEHMAISMLPIVLSGIGTLAGKYFQDRAAKFKERQEYISQRIPKVDSALDSISSNMDTLSYFADQALYSLVFRTETYSNQSKTNQIDRSEEAAWDRYIASLVQWERSRTTYLGQVKTYFGDDLELQLEGIQKGFDKIDQFLKATYYERNSSRHFLEDKPGKNDFRTKYYKHKNSLDSKIKTLNIGMIAASHELSK